MHCFESEGFVQHTFFGIAIWRETLHLPLSLLIFLGFSTDFDSVSSLLVGLVVPLKWYSGYICNGVMFSKVVGENLLQFRDVIWIATGTQEEAMFLVDFLCWLETEKFGCRALDTSKCEDCKAPRSSGVGFCRTKLLESSRFSTSDQWVCSHLSSLIFLDDVHPMCPIPSCLLKFEWYLALLQSTIVITTFSLQLCCNLCSVECARLTELFTLSTDHICFPVASKWEHQHKINILHHGWVFMPSWCEPRSSVPHSPAVQ